MLKYAKDTIPTKLLFQSVLNIVGGRRRLKKYRSVSCYRPMARMIKRRRRKVERVPSNYTYNIQVCCRSLGTGNVLEQPLAAHIQQSFSSHSPWFENYAIRAEGLLGQNTKNMDLFQLFGC